MGILDLFSSSGRNKSADSQQEALGAYSGMRVEVLSLSGQLLFVAKLFLLRGGIVELQLPSDAVDTAPNPEETEPFQANLRGYDATQRKAIHMTGLITPVTRELWRVERLKIVSKDNDRAFFRQPTSAAGEVSLSSRPGVGRFALAGHPGAASHVCEVRNISAGGVCIQTDEAFRMGDRLLLKSRLLPGGQLSSLLCEVRRITQRRGNVFEYGCQFIDLSSADEDLIAKAIMDMQRIQAKRQTGR